MSRSIGCGAGTTAESEGSDSTSNSASAIDLKSGRRRFDPVLRHQNYQCTRANIKNRNGVAPFVAPYAAISRSVAPCGMRDSGPSAQRPRNAQPKLKASPEKRQRAKTSSALASATY
jgi:hypothetical protein